jgi:multidrug efflux pump
MFTQRNQYHVILESLPKLQETPQTLDNIYVNSSVTTSPPINPNATSTPTLTSTTGPVLLRTFTKVSQEAAPLLITREGQFPVATLSFNLAPNAALGDAINAVHEIRDGLNLPPGMQAGFEGAAKIFEQSLSNEGWLIMASICVVYILLGVLYESYIHPITILSTLPSAAMGALLALILTNNSLSIIALIGIILLIGIVMKNAILMIDFALEQERVYGKDPLDAIHQAALLRFRPILMTTMASMLGAVPLAFGTGMGAELRQPLGIAIIGGLFVSQLLTLYTTPVIYLSFDRLARKFGVTSAIGLPPLAKEEE